MRLYETVKVFDLSCAPSDLREADDLAPLRPNTGYDTPAILTLKVGDYHGVQDGPLEDRSRREVTFIEFRLHRWLAEQGAQEGEEVFLCWKGGADW